MPEFETAFGERAGFLTRMSTDFFAGLAFADIGQTIDQSIDEGIGTSSGLTFEQRRLFREVVAGNEFERRNCSLIGL